ncbi:Zn-dependent hydrolases, including glyoxylases [Halarchaeum acidiphilum MH1-52-1]|uniref:Zn-dependent hydrolases, including glyoxylases n=2 Tax=Halarchaeum acidiphilum TaxID=489138 RepID=U3AB26_9EURY|nr:MBL fold metallo-hydrolase [Halarchaeum acidiphilum]GAD51968.1 Zn-dependent hydrolases, including glyoxylases [Halarchaeum acidiphilum MH1-52-1]
MSGSGIERVSIPVDPPAPTGRTNAYVVDGVLVDPGARHDRLDALVDGVAHVVATHAHPDHVGALAHYADASDATVWAHASFVERFVDATGVTPDRTYRDGDSVESLDVVATPGHAPDHVAFARGDDYLVGDCCRAGGSVAIGPDGDMRAYLTGLRRLSVRDPARLHPGHGGPIGRPRERLAGVIAHRRERERRVLAAVEGGARTIDGVLDAAYDAALGEYRDLAVATVRAHLEKLDTEGRVTVTRADGEVVGAKPRA